MNVGVSDSRCQTAPYVIEDEAKSLLAHVNIDDLGRAYDFHAVRDPLDMLRYDLMRLTLSIR
jgi:hypothetical protein